MSSAQFGEEEGLNSGPEDSYENEEVTATVAPQKRSKLSKKELLKPPTNEELNQLRETENLFHSNLFRLQIEEMFNEIKIKERHAVIFQEWFKNISAFLNDLENLKAKEMPCRKWLKKLGMKMPLKQLSAEVSGVFLFAKPAAVKLIGSYANGCCVGPNIRADVLIQMPRKCFQRGDPLNYKYFYKRALYLTYLAAKLKQSDLVEEVKFAHGHGIANRPVLIVKPSGKLGKRFTVVMNLAPPPKCFKHHVFSPLKSNVQENWYLGGDGSEEVETGPPTPHYNSGILMDLTVHENEEILSNALSENQNLKDGIKLLKIWLHQRELDEGYGSFSAYIMSMYVVYLMQERRLSNLMSSYQVVRTVWNCLATSDWTTKGISLAEALKNKEWIPLDNFHQQFEVVFVDATGFYNLCATMSKSTFLRVKHESQLAVKCLDNPNLNSFQALFMTKVQFYQQFDHIITNTRVWS
ncbi:hypothetical protein J437_LFUL015338 [Ladona fulva]|uniref:Nucleolar protein 6 n=1 Tax=Ladona fulva TaxID=123851 RepID=A0A8K0KYE5_LADFU|nr:hypothetical protein J437_LFUL015338 [Ladona fulva]